MKPIFFLVCIVLLLADLTDDGYPGKAQALLPQGPGIFSVTTSQDTSGNMTPLVWLTPGALRFILQRWQNQPVLIEVGNSLAKIDCCLLGSSGGIPL
jgi:hypothetical protein